MRNNMSRLIILDRDGVINALGDDYICSTAEWRALPGALNAIAKFCKAGFKVAVITNQSGIAKGLYTTATLNEIHKKMSDEVRAAGGAINTILFCPHADADNCECRKPKPGMFLQLAAQMQHDLSGVFAVGDSMRDLVAARAAGASPILVTTGYGVQTAAQLSKNKFAAVPIYKDLAACAEAIIKNEIVI